MKLRKISKVIFAVIATVIFFGIITSALVVTFFPRDMLSRIITGIARDATGRELVIGSVNYSPFGANFDDIVFHDGPDRTSPVLFRARNLSVRFSLLPLLRKKVELRRITFTGLSVTVQYADGRFNIQKLLDDLSSGSGQKSSVQTTVPDLVFKDAEVKIESLPDQFKSARGIYQFSGKLDFGGKRIRGENVHFTLPSNRGVINGSFSFDTTHGVPLNITGTGTIEDLELTWLYQMINNPSIPFTRASAELPEFRYTKGHLIAPRVIASGKLTTGNTLRVTGGLDLALPRVIVQIHDAAAEVANSTAEFSRFTVNTTSPQVISFQARTADLMLQDILPIIGKDLAFISGRFKGSTSFIAEKLSANGELSEASLRMGKAVCSIPASNILLTNNRFSVENIPFRLNSRPGTLSLASNREDFTDFSANINFPALAESDLQGLAIPALGGGQKATHGKDLKPFRARGIVTIGATEFKKIALSGVSVTYNFDGKTISLPAIRLRALDADITGSADIVASEARMPLTLKLAFQNLKVQRLAEIEAEFGNRIFGFARGRADLRIDLKAPVPIDTLAGHCEFAIDKGKLVNTGLQNNLGFLLDSLKFKLRDLEFNTIYGNFDIDGSQYSIRSLLFNSRDIRLSLKGDVNKSKAGDLDMRLEFNSDFIADVPNITYTVINRYKSGKWFVIPIKIKGKDVTDKANISFADQGAS